MANVKKNKKSTNNGFSQTKFLITVFVALFLGFLVYQASKTTATGSDGAVPGGDIPLATLDGGTITLNQFAGKILIVDFWATWCPPCKMEIPGYIKLYNKYRDKGLEIIGVTLQSGTVQDVKAFVEEHGINYPIVMGNNQIVQAYGGITGFPTTFIVDQKGRIVRKYVGFRPEAVFDEDIRTLLRAN
ncbi:MAG: TlpA disulfide reductase family protein [candidate division KSB1 bacterium]|nr:TlpA disulfide reductase family protein [candidate division KSB1 bacterium]